MQIKEILPKIPKELLLKILNSKNCGLKVFEETLKEYKKRSPKCK